MLKNGVNVFNIAIFAISHSLMARPFIKEKILKLFPSSFERPLYVFQSAFLLHRGNMKNEIKSKYK